MDPVFGVHYRFQPWFVAPGPAYRRPSGQLAVWFDKLPSMGPNLRGQTYQTPETKTSALSSAVSISWTNFSSRSGTYQGTYQGTCYWRMSIHELLPVSPATSNMVVPIRMLLPPGTG